MFVSRVLLLVGALNAVATTAPIAGSPAASESDDEARIAFVSGTFNADLFAISPAGKTAEQLTSTAGSSEAAPDWAADGRTLAYVAPRADGPLAAERAVYVRWPDGSIDGLSFGPLDIDPDWAPDGQRIIFASILEPGKPGQTTALTVAALPDGLDQRPLLEPLQRSDVVLTGPKWSPDGRRVVFVVAADLGASGINEGGELYIANADGTEARRLFAHPGWDDVEPAWSPDGNQIAFASGFIAPVGGTPRHGLWLLDVRSGAAGQLLADQRLALRHPTWSPDGTRLAFEARLPGAIRGDIHITSLIKPSVDEPLIEGGEPDWAPLGQGSVPTHTPPPAPTAGPSPTAGNEPTATVTPSGGPPMLPTLAPLAPFPTLPPAEPTHGPLAPQYEVATASPSPSPSSTRPIGPLPTISVEPRPYRIVLPVLHCNWELVAPTPAGHG